MAEPIHIRIQADAAPLTNLHAQVQQFARALGQIDRQSRGVFFSLEQLSQRYQQRGFLGKADQQVLERSLKQWETVSRHVAAQRTAAQGTLEDVRAGGLLTPHDVRTERQAEQTFRRFDARQRAMATLERRRPFWACHAPPLPPLGRSRRRLRRRRTPRPGGRAWGARRRGRLGDSVAACSAGWEAVQPRWASRRAWPCTKGRPRACRRTSSGRGVSSTCSGN